LNLILTYSQDTAGRPCNAHGDFLPRGSPSDKEIVHHPDNLYGSQGMRREMIRSCPSWKRGPERRDCVLIVEDEELDGMHGMVVGRVKMFFSFEHKDSFYPCALVDRFARVGRAPDPLTGMWKVKPETVKVRGNTVRVRTVEHLETILRAVHLIPVFGNGDLPSHFDYRCSLDAFEMYYVNKYIDHHAHETVF
jgi:hypothetical protein